MTADTYLKKRGVTRLCHFTKLKDLTHIIASDYGIVANLAIRPDVKDAKDPARYDGELEYVCCSVEYPNSWYLRSAIRRDQDEVFRDWVAIYIDLSILSYRDIKFCACNASKKRGAYIFDDVNQIGALYASPTVDGRTRTPRMLPCCPTDDQAEILVKDNIPYEFIKGIAVCDEEVAALVYAMVKTYGKSEVPIYVAPDVLGTGWSREARAGVRPLESELSIGREE